MMDDGGASRHTVIETLLRDVFDWQQHLVIDDAVPETLTEFVADHGVRLRPDFGYFDEDAEDSADDADADEDETRTKTKRTNPRRRAKASPPPRGGRRRGHRAMETARHGHRVGDASADADLDRDLVGERRRAARRPAARPRRSRRDRHRRPLVGSGVGAARFRGRGRRVGRFLVQRGTGVPAGARRAARPQPVPGRSAEEQAARPVQGVRRASGRGHRDNSAARSARPSNCSSPRSTSSTASRTARCWPASRTTTSTRASSP